MTDLGPRPAQEASSHQQALPANQYCDKKEDMDARRFAATGILFALLVAPAGDVLPSDPPPAPAFRLEPERREQAIAYSRARYRLFFVSAGWSVALLLLLLSARVAPSLRDLAEGVVASPGLQALVFVPILVISLAILELPLGLYAHRLELTYQQSIQGWGSWLLDWAKGQALATVLTTLLVWILYAILRASPARAWLWFWLASQPVLLFVFFIEPVVIAPLFFRFEPLAERHPELVREIGKVVDRAGLGIPPERMFEMKASEKLRSVNAYVAGIGASKRVVVWDTTVAKMSTPETLFIFAHETGHYVLHHIPRLLAFASVALLVFFVVGQQAAEGFLARFGASWQIRALDDLASLPVLLVVAAVLGFFAAPVFNAYSRAIEHEADVYALDLTQGVLADPRGTAVAAFQALGEIDLADPDPPPFIRFWLYSHPPIAERIAFAAGYQPR
jgi:Zn-dependent protease with chaperone function